MDNTGKPRITVTPIVSLPTKIATKRSSKFDSESSETSDENEDLPLVSKVRRRKSKRKPKSKYQSDMLGDFLMADEGDVTMDEEMSSDGSDIEVCLECKGPIEVGRKPVACKSCGRKIHTACLQFTNSGASKMSWRCPKCLQSSSDTKPRQNSLVVDSLGPTLLQHQQPKVEKSSNSGSFLKGNFPVKIEIKKSPSVFLETKSDFGAWAKTVKPIPAEDMKPILANDFKPISAGVELKPFHSKESIAFLAAEMKPFLADEESKPVFGAEAKPFLAGAMKPNPGTETKATLKSEKVERISKYPITITPSPRLIPKVTAKRITKITTKKGKNKNKLKPKSRPGKKVQKVVRKPKIQKICAENKPTTSAPIEEIFDVPDDDIVEVNVQEAKVATDFSIGDEKDLHQVAKQVFDLHYRNGDVSSVNNVGVNVNDGISVNVNHGINVNVNDGVIDLDSDDDVSILSESASFATPSKQGTSTPKSTNKKLPKFSPRRQDLPDSLYKKHRRNLETFFGGSTSRPNSSDQPQNQKFHESQTNQTMKQSPGNLHPSLPGISVHYFPLQTNGSPKPSAFDLSRTEEPFYEPKKPELNLSEELPPNVSNESKGTIFKTSPNGQVESSVQSKRVVKVLVSEFQLQALINLGITVVDP